MLVLCAFIFSGPETALLAEINAAREAAGVDALALNTEAARLARYKSEEMVRLNFFGHGSRLYGEPDEMLVRFGVPFESAGVNIAKGQDSVEDVVRAWLSSPAHRENLLRPDYTAAGVGLAFDEGLPYWTVFFISSVKSGTSGMEEAVLPFFLIRESKDARVSLCMERFLFSSERKIPPPDKIFA